MAKRTVHTLSAGALIVSEQDDASGQWREYASRTISADQIAAHRRDPAFEAALPAAIKAQLPA